MKIHRMIQGTPEWLAIRAGIPTASEFDNLVTPLWKPKESAAVDTYLAKKVAERWLGMPVAEKPAFGAMEQGKIKEEEAIPYYEFTAKEDVEQVGFVTTDDGLIGCSPDGLLASGGLEIKCPEAHTHVGYLLGGRLPKAYAAQVHGCMLVTGARSWKFMSYCRGFPTFLLTVERDEEVIRALTDALDTFNEKLNTLYARLVAINGQEPERHAITMRTENNVTTATLEGVDQDALEAFMNSPAMNG